MKGEALKKSISSLGFIFALIAIVVLVNALSANRLKSYNLDLTEAGLYSLSNGTSEIIRELETPITLRFYFSKTEAH